MLKSIEEMDEETLQSQTNERTIKNKPRKSRIFSSLLPIYLSKLQSTRRESNRSTSSFNFEDYKETSTQCDSIESRVDLLTATFLSVPSDAVFLISVGSQSNTKHVTHQLKPRQLSIRKSSSFLDVEIKPEFREIGTQTYQIIKNGPEDVEEEFELILEHLVSQATKIRETWRFLSSFSFARNSSK